MTFKDKVEFFHCAIPLDDFILREKTADKYFDKNSFLAVCAYNKTFFSNSYLSKVIDVHPIEIDLIRTRF